MDSNIEPKPWAHVLKDVWSDKEIHSLSWVENKSMVSDIGYLTKTKSTLWSTQASQLETTWRNSAYRVSIEVTHNLSPEMSLVDSGKNTL